MSPPLDKVSPTHHSEYGMGGWENEKWCEGSTRAAQRCSLRGNARTGAPRGGNLDCSDARSGVETREKNAISLQSYTR